MMIFDVCFIRGSHLIVICSRNWVSGPGSKIHYLFLNLGNKYPFSATMSCVMHSNMQPAVNLCRLLSKSLDRNENAMYVTITFSELGLG